MSNSTVCMYVCVYMCVFGGVYVCMHGVLGGIHMSLSCLYICVWRLEVDVKYCFLTASLSYILRQGLSLNLDLSIPARLTGQQAPGILLSLLSQC